MKRLLLVVIAFLGLSVVAKADGIGDQIKTSLLGQIQPIHQYTTHGDSRIALLDDVLQIGHFKGEYLGFAQVGPSTTVGSGDGRIEGYLIGGSFNWSPVIRSFVNLPSGWRFLNEQFIISSGYHYDTAMHKGTLSYLQFSVVVHL